jgi:phosphate transport system substrate-binding protein
MKAKRMIALSLLAAGLGAALAVPARTLIQNKGSDTLVNVAQAWAEAYPAVNPEVAVAVSGGGSGTGIAAMINGTVDIANSSRSMEEREIKAAEANGQHPVEHLVGFDALAVFINDKNPVTALSIEQLRDIYGRGAKYTRWSDLGVKVPGCDSDEIIVASRQNNSGTYAYFKEAVLGEKGKYRTGTLDMHGSKEVVDLVEKTACAIGYSGLAYATGHVKMVCVAAQTGAPCVAPSVATASDHSYPIARPLYMYTNGEPRGEVKNYLEWILSDAGQCILMKKGYAPVRELKCE